MCICFGCSLLHRMDVLFLCLLKEIKIKLNNGTARGINLNVVFVSFNNNTIQLKSNRSENIIYEDLTFIC